MSTQYMKNCWDRMLAKEIAKGKTRITVETGQYKGAYPQTVKAYAKANGYEAWAQTAGIWVIETNKNWLEDIKKANKK